MRRCERSRFWGRGEEGKSALEHESEVPTSCDPLQWDVECGVVTWGACGRPCAQFVDSYGVAVFLEVGESL